MSTNNHNSSIPPRYVPTRSASASTNTAPPPPKFNRTPSVPKLMPLHSSDCLIINKPPSSSSYPTTCFYPTDDRPFSFTTPASVRQASLFISSHPHVLQVVTPPPAPAPPHSPSASSSLSSDSNLFPLPDIVHVSPFQSAFPPATNNLTSNLSVLLEHSSSSSSSPSAHTPLNSIENHVVQARTDQNIPLDYSASITSIHRPEPEDSIRRPHTRRSTSISQHLNDINGHCLVDQDQFQQGPSGLLGNTLGNAFFPNHQHSPELKARPVFDNTLNGGGILDDELYTPLLGSPHTSPNFNVTNLVSDILSATPSVILGLILNVLDGLSFGYIIFPINDPCFKEMGSDGISMFFVSTLASQLVITTMSSFKCGTGSMIIEVIPFLHTMAQMLAADLIPMGIDPMPTVLVSFILSTLLTSLAFFLLGAFRLGNVIQFFPRHILVGSIGGVGFFLLQTAIEITGHIKITYTYQTFQTMFTPLVFAQWSSALVAALVLRIALATNFDNFLLGTNPRRRGLFVPCYFLLIPLIFHLVLYLIHVDLESARKLGWLFDLVSDKPFYAFYRHLRFTDVHWSSLPALIPAMLSLTFFSVLHVPINVPALSVSTHTGVSVNRELANHDSTSVMLHRSGGDSRVAGYLLFFLTAIVWMKGGTMMQLVPTISVGALMFHLGIDLLKEAVWDTRGLVTRLEYGTICAIILSMALLGFTEGVGVGIILACVFFVVSYAARAKTAVIARDRHGTVWGSPVRRMPSHRHMLTTWSKHTVHVLELQGFIFFGTVHHVTKRIQEIVAPDWRSDGPATAERKRKQRRLVWPDYSDALLHHNPNGQLSTPFDACEPEFPPSHAKVTDLHPRPQFLILDFARAADIDFSAGEAFVNIQKLLAANHVGLVLAGVGGSGHGHIAQALQRAGVWPSQRVPFGDRSSVVCCASLSGALEYCENAVLAGVTMPPPSDAILLLAAPRHHKTGNEIISEVQTLTDPDLALLAAMVLGGTQPTNVNETVNGGVDPFWDNMMDASAKYAPLFATLVQGIPLFERHVLSQGTVLWRAGDYADSVVFVLSGALVDGPVPPTENTHGHNYGIDPSLVLHGSEQNRIRHNPPDSAQEPTLPTWDPESRWVTFLPGTCIGARSFITGMSHPRACWVASVVGEEPSSVDDVAVVYYVRRHVLNQVDPVLALEFIRMVVQVDDQ